MPSRRMSCLKPHSLLTMMTVVGVVGGTFVGMGLRGMKEEGWTKREVMYIKFPGEIFLRMLKTLIVPLLTSSIISAVGSLDLSLSKKIAMRSITFYATTTVCAVILGIILVLVVKPGRGFVSAEDLPVPKKDDVRPVLTQDTLMDLIRNLFPPNLIEATISQSQTHIIVPPDELESFKYCKRFATPANTTDCGKLNLTQYDFTEKYEGTTNVLGLVMFSIVFGVTIGKMAENGRTLLSFFDTMAEAMMIITSWVIWISPLGVFFLVTAQVLEIKSVTALVGQLGLYFMTVLIGLFIHGLGTLTVIYFLATRTLPFRNIAKMGQVMVTAFGTASSSATMPITIQTLDKMGIDPRVTRFVIPVGATINMDGTALYEAVAAIFIAQRNGMSLSLGQAAAVCVTATAASIGAAGIPQAGLVTMVMVLDTVGLPADQVSIILAVDWLLDRFRTTVNVMCDCLGACIVDKLSIADLKAIPEADKANADPHELVEITKVTEPCF